MTQRFQPGTLDRKVVDLAMHGVVQVVALRKAMFGNLSSAWTGSGTIVHPSGIILTNCHVANPHAMGMPAPAVDRLAIAITQRSDEPPALTYYAEIAAQSPELDLAVLRISSGLDGKPVSGLDLPFVAPGDSDNLELGDSLSIFGYPGIGGETVTFTRGAVAGFSKQEGVRDRRAWIKTDATIAGGNSGGTAVDRQGKLVGVPTQAAAGSGITPVDARPVIDTNRDGRVDERDTPMAVGGFINGLRPVNLAAPLLKQVIGDKTPKQAPKKVPKPSGSAAPATRPKATRSSGPKFSSLTFSSRVTSDGRPIHPAGLLPSGGKTLFVTFDYDGMRNGTGWSQVWALDGRQIVSDQAKWEDGPRGRKTMQLQNPRGLTDGEYHLVLAVKNQIVKEGKVVIGRRVDDTDTEVSGVVVDSATGRGIGEALVIALQPGTSVQQFIEQQRREMAFSTARTGRDGGFTFPEQLPKGQAYGLVVVARGYGDMAIEGALRIGADAPEKARMSPIPMRKG